MHPYLELAPSAATAGGVDNIWGVSSYATEGEIHHGRIGQVLYPKFRAEPSMAVNRVRMKRITSSMVADAEAKALSGNRDKEISKSLIGEFPNVIEIS